MVDIILENEQDALTVTEEIESAIRRVCERTLESEECDFDAQISVTLTDDTRNKQGKPRYRQAYRRFIVPAARI